MGGVFDANRKNIFLAPCLVKFARNIFAGPIITIGQTVFIAVTPKRRGDNFVAVFDGFVIKRMADRIACLLYTSPSPRD